MIGMGSVFAAVFDTYNRFLNRKGRKIWFVFINDILFWCFQAVLIYFVLFQVNFGEVRFYLILALLCGYSMYQALLKKTYLYILEHTIILFKMLWKWTKKGVNLLILTPSKWILLVTSSLLLLCFSLVTNVAKISFNLAKTLLRAVLSILGFFLSPVFWTLKFIFKFVPKRIREKIDVIFTKIKNRLLKIKKGLSDFYAKLTNKSR